MSRCDYKREHDGYLDEEVKTVSARQTETFDVPQISRSMLLPEACREAHHAEVAECALFATLNSLKSWTAQNIKSPFSNIRAVTFKLCFHSSWIALANRPGSNSRSVTKTP